MLVAAQITKSNIQSDVPISKLLSVVIEIINKRHSKTETETDFSQEDVSILTKYTNAAVLAWM